MDVADRTQSFSRLFCRQVALGFASISYPTINLRTVAERSSGG